MGTKNTDYKNSYNKDNYSRIALYFPKDFKDNISDYCNAADVPMAEFIKKLVYDEIGDYFKDCSRTDNGKLEMFFLGPEMFITCGKRWICLFPNDNWHILGAKITGDCREQLVDYFAKKMPDAGSFNIWKKVLNESKPRYFFCGDDLDNELGELIENVDGKFRKYREYKIYDSDDYAEEEKKYIRITEIK